MSRERERYGEIGKKIKREVDDHQGMGRRHVSLGPPGTLNTITPCAACKLLRRRCAQECPFSPYFSPHEPHKFASVHKVFGASNVSKMLMEVAETQRADAANSLVYEANVRLRDPVYGCMGAISALQHQLQSLQAELNAVRAEVLKYKYREETNNNINNIIPTTVPSLLSTVSVAAPPPPPTSASYSAPDYTSISNNNDNVSYFVLGSPAILGSAKCMLRMARKSFLVQDTEVRQHVSRYHVRHHVRWSRSDRSLTV